MIKEYLELGQIVSTHGIKGEVRFNPWCDTPEFVKNFKTLYFKDGTGINVLRARPHGNICVLLLDGVDSVEKAQALKNKVLYIKREDARLDSGTWFVQELIGCSVFDAGSGKPLGTVSDVSRTGANDVWHIKTKKNGEVLIPAVKDVVVSVDVAQSKILINPLKGLFDDED